MDSFPLVKSSCEVRVSVLDGIPWNKGIFREEQLTTGRWNFPSV